jgi:8-oxo-dGTP pyrophosphatase MutT (NUDIX family)
MTHLDGRVKAEHIHIKNLLQSQTFDAAYIVPVTFKDNEPWVMYLSTDAYPSLILNNCAKSSIVSEGRWLDCRLNRASDSNAIYRYTKHIRRSGAEEDRRVKSHHSIDCRWMIGGKCHDDETAIDAIVREYHEEVGLRIDDFSILGAVQLRRHNHITKRAVRNLVIFAWVTPLDFKKSLLAVSREGTVSATPLRSQLSWAHNLADERRKRFFSIIFDHAAFLTWMSSDNVLLKIVWTMSMWMDVWSHESWLQTSREDRVYTEEGVVRLPIANRSFIWDEVGKKTLYTMFKTAGDWRADIFAPDTGYQHVGFTGDQPI